MKSVSFNKFKNIPLIKFIIVGGIGFIIDGSILLILRNYGLDLTLCRIVSFSIAVICTWLLNKNWTFSINNEVKNNPPKHYLYFLFQCVGAIINFIVFVFLTKNFIIMHLNPLFPFSIASGLAMIFNYLTSKLIVFKSR
ncbi:GtrA family protein [Pantoea sp.]|uniref:GtrA family protein n=1 Tax=Pantoea sp. TaxID=69393 RepID=UPI003917E3F6